MSTLAAINPSSTLKHKPKALYFARLAFTFALREMRAGVRGFMIFLACLSLGVAAIAGVNALSASLVSSISSEGQSILGGDLRFSLIHREADEKERAYLESLGPLTVNATMRAMARLPDGSDQTLAELKGVDNAYPLYGEMKLQSGGSLQDALKPKADKTYGGVGELGLLARLNLKVGDTVNLGNINLIITDVIESEPDRLAGSVGFGPRLIVSQAALRASNLVQPGSLVRWHYKIKLGETISREEVENVRIATQEAFPKAGWRVRSRDNASPGLSRNIERFAQFLTLVGLTALIVGGVGVANAVTAYLDSKREVIATFKSIGATGEFVFAIYIIQILIIASIAIAIGVVLGSFIPTIAAYYLRETLPVDIDTTVQPAALALAALYGYLMALVFALWPLARARDIPPTALFRDHEAGGRRLPRPIYLAMLLSCIAILFILAIGLSDNRQIAIYFSVGTAVSFGLLRLIAIGIMSIAKRLPHAKSTEWRLAIGNIHRPGSITPSVVLSLGLGLTLLVSIALIDGNLRNQLTSSLADEAPSFFFVDVQNHEVGQFETLLRDNAKGAKLERVPMLRGFFVEIDGKKPSDMVVPSESQWALRGDRGITYSATIPENSILHEGKWWAEDHEGPSLVSFDEEVARHFGLKIGDQITINVLGREITSTLASTRKVEWQSLGINFVMVFSPNTFANAPHSHLATLTYEDGGTVEKEFNLMKTVAAQFPTITMVRVKDALERVADVVGQMAWAIRGASGVTLLSSILVLAGALAAGHRTQIYDAVILKTLGATRAQLIKAYLIQYTLLGTITATFGILSGTLASWFVVENIMDGDFIFLPSAAFSAALTALTLCISLGLIGTWRILGQKAAPLLRNL
ncbi:MAG: ABC transporter permease [Hyphomicrobiales bacterium]